MARRKKADDVNAAPPPPVDRHRPRKMVTIPPRLHALLSELADKNGRPLNWELRLLLERHLREAGLLPPRD